MKNGDTGGWPAMLARKRTWASGLGSGGAAKAPVRRPFVSAAGMGVVENDVGA